LIKIPAYTDVLSGVGKYSRMELLFNSAVVSFESGYENAGLDFTAYSETDEEYSVFNTQCYPSTTANRRCTFYNTPTSL
jgi:hypothetical protein